MKTIFKFCFILFTMSQICFASEGTPEVIGRLKEATGEIINIYSSYGVDQEGNVLFKNEKDKMTKMDAEDVLWIEVGETIYLRQKVDKKKEKYFLRHLFAYNEKYKLYSMNSKSDMNEKIIVHVYDMDDNLVERLTYIYGEPKFDKKQGAIVDSLEKYFGNCPDLISALRKNIELKRKDLFGEIHYTPCPDSPDKSLILK